MSVESLCQLGFFFLAGGIAGNASVGPADGDKSRTCATGLDEGPYGDVAVYNTAGTRVPETVKKAAENCISCSSPQLSLPKKYFRQAAELFATFLKLQKVG